MVVSLKNSNLFSKQNIYFYCVSGGPKILDKCKRHTNQDGENASLCNNSIC